MISSELLASYEKSVRKCSYQGISSDKMFGVIPVVLLFGDDNQLPPVISKSGSGKGAFHAHLDAENNIHQNYGMKLFK